MTDSDTPQKATQTVCPVFVVLAILAVNESFQCTPFVSVRVKCRAYTLKQTISGSS